MSQNLKVFFLIVLAFTVALFIALPKDIPIHFGFANRRVDLDLKRPPVRFNAFGRQVEKEFELKQGLDIQGGMQLVLRADMSSISAEKQVSAIESAQDIIRRRVDMFGVAEPVVQTSKVGNEQRIIVELAGVKDPNQAMSLVGRTAQLDFRLEAASPSADATTSALAFFAGFTPTGITGEQLKGSSLQFDPQTREPVVSIEFNDEGREKFAQVTKDNTGKILGIFLDGFPVSLPRISTPIYDGVAAISGGFGVEEAKQLNIQLNAGALPVPIEIIDIRTVGASLGQEAVSKSVFAGAVGIGLVILFMIAYYGWKGVLASIALCFYAVFTIAIYKLLGITLTLPGIAGLLLTIGMAVDSNILIFERMKEEQRLGKSFHQSMELGFGRAWDSIKDANVATLFTSFILINPLDFSFLNTSGLVRGFGITLCIGVLMSLFTGMIVTKTLMRLFLKEKA